MDKNFRKFNNLVSMFFHLLKRVNTYVRKIDRGEINIDIYSKGPNDSFTTADYVIQKMFELHLEKYYPNIKIIGEEDTKNNLIKECELYSIDPLKDINMNLLPEDLFTEETANLNVDDLVFFIDPIDSTSSFIKKNYKPSTVMIGLTLKEKPLMGILHYFFWEGKNNCTKTIFNIPKKGVFEYNLDENSMEEFQFKKNENEVVILTSRSRTIPETSNGKKFILNVLKIYNKSNLNSIIAFELFENKNIQFVSGLGNKGYQLMVVDGLYISSCSDMGFWDSCAAHCLVNELGGGFYYFDGTEVKYDVENDNKRMNGFFIICASKEKKDLFFEVYNKNKQYFDNYFK